MQRENSYRLDNIVRYIGEVIGSKTCRVRKNSGLEWTTHNSSVLSFQTMEVVALFQSLSGIRTAVSFVSVTGGSGERLHYHSSHLFGMIIKGSGLLITRGEGEAKAEASPLSAGDTVLIPKGTLHAIECAQSETLDFIALEISDEEIEAGPASIKEP